MFWGCLGGCFDVLGCFETYWDVFCFFLCGSLVTFWGVMERFEQFGTFWDVLGYFGTFWDILRRFEMFWDILGRFVMFLDMRPKLAISS